MRKINQQYNEEELSLEERMHIYYSGVANQLATDVYNETNVLVDVSLVDDVLTLSLVDTGKTILLLHDFSQVYASINAKKYFALAVHRIDMEVDNGVARLHLQ